MPSFLKQFGSSLTDPLDSNLLLVQDSGKQKLVWLDALWIFFLGILALLPPSLEWHKLIILAAIGVSQLYERTLLQRLGFNFGRFAIVLLKIILGTFLLRYSDLVPIINSDLYYIYYMPVISAAAMYEIWGTLVWTAVAVAAYCSYLLPGMDPAIGNYEVTNRSVRELAIRSIFLFLTAVVISRLVMQNRRQTLRYQKLAETLAETNRQLTQAQEEARRSERLAALGQLSAGLAHEIRNPLGVIKGSAEMLNKKMVKVDAVSAELTGYISSEVNRLNGLVSRFLDFARPLKIEPRLQDLAPILDQALKSVDHLRPDHPVKILREVPEKLPQIRVDAGACEQVFINLFSNAFDAMPEGGTLSIRAIPVESGGRKGVEVQVQDTGPGIPSNLREQVFNPFFTTKKEGVGLGLSIVSKIVDDHQGWIRITDVDGKGACFHLFLPGKES
jgi:signal transduction histidine kinase